MGKQRGTDTGYDSPDVSSVHALDGVAKRLWSGRSRTGHSLESTVAFAIMRGQSVSCPIACKAVSICKVFGGPEHRTKINGETDFAPSNICQS